MQYVYIRARQNRILVDFRLPDALKYLKLHRYYGEDMIFLEIIQGFKQKLTLWKRPQLQYNVRRPLKDLSS